MIIGPSRAGKGPGKGPESDLNIELFQPTGEVFSLLGSYALQVRQLIHS